MWMGGRGVAVVSDYSLCACVLGEEVGVRVRAEGGVGRLLPYYVRGQSYH